MAKLGDWIVPFHDYSPDNWMEWEGDFESLLKRENEELDKLIEKSNNLPDGEVVGGVLRFGVGDGYATYLVTKEKPLTLSPLWIGDHYRVPYLMIKGHNMGDVLYALKRQKYSPFKKERMG